MNHFFQPMFANGMAIMVMLFYAWTATVIVAAVLAVTALVLAIRRKAALTTRILGGVACAIDLVPIAIALWVVLGPVLFGRDNRPPFSLYQFTVLFLTVLPGLVASAALLVSFRRPPPPTPPAASPA
jgi:dolichyl-phosphate-mannose--protein O-mannosyl transferase